MATISTCTIASVTPRSRLVSLKIRRSKQILFQDYNYTLPYPPHHDYWNKGRIHWNIPDNEKPLKYNMNLGFHVFGKFSGKTSVIKG